MQNLNIAFFTEAGSKRGMGHLVRCYTIYQEYIKQKHTVDFYLDSDIDYTYKFNYIKKISWDNLKFDKLYDIIFIDSYEATLKIYENSLIYSKITVCIDDYGRLDYPKSIILNFAPDAKELFFNTKKDGYYYLLGLDYIPIRDNFLTIKKEKRNQIFLMLGGADTANLSVEIIEILKKIDIKKVIVINNEKDIPEIKKYNNIKVLYKPTDSELIQNMANSSIAISTASMTVYELNYLQVPTIILAINSHQSNGISQLLKHKVAIDCVDITKNYKNLLINKIYKLINNQVATHKKNIDGNGIIRIINQTIKLLNK